MDKEQAQGKIEKYFKRNFPEENQLFEVMLKPTGVDVNSENIKNLVKAVYMVFLSKETDSTTKLYIMVRQFAKALKDDKRIMELTEIWEGKKTKLAVPTIEITVIKHLSTISYKVNKQFYCGKKSYSLAELNELLQMSKRNILDVFFDIYMENDIRVPVDFPTFGTEGLPKL